MASPPLVLPGSLFVGEDERARVITHTGPAAGWHVPRGILGWSHEVSLVAREALTEDIRRSAKIVMPEEQIPPARMPLTAQAAQKSPLVATSSRLTQKLVDAGVRVHTVGVDRVTSSFYYLAEGGGEEQIRIEGDLVQSVGQMLGDRADNAAIERVLDGLVDRLLRALSKDRVTELSVELAAALPRAAADGSGTADVDLDTFEKNLGELIAKSERHSAPAREIATKLEDTNERRLDVPLFGEARKVSQGPFDLQVGEGKVTLPTYERWVMQNPLGGVAAAPGATAAAEPAAAPAKRPSVADDDPMLAKLDERAPSAEEAAARKRAEDEAAASRKRVEEAAARKKADEAAAAKKRAEEEAAAAKKRADEAAAAKKRADEEAAAKKRAEDEAVAAKKRAEEEAAAAEAAAKKRAEEEAAAEAAKKKAADEAAAAAEAAKKAEEAAAAEKAEKAKKKAAEDHAEAAEKKKADDDASKAADKASADKKKPADTKAAAKTATSDKSSTTSDTVKLKKREPEKSGSMTWIAIAVAILAAVAVWRLFLHH